MNLMPLSYSRLSTYENCPAKFDYLYVTKSVKDEDNEYTVYGSRVHESLEKAGRDGTPLPDDLAKFHPLVERIISQPGRKEYERQMAIRRDKTPCDWFASDVWIRGIADVLILDGDRAWCLDWKTGKPRDNPTQLQLFAALIFAHYPEVAEVRTGYIWLHHNDITSTTYRKQHEPHLWLALEPRFARVQEAVDLGVYKTKPSGLCRFCPAKGLCPDARR